MNASTQSLLGEHASTVAFSEELAGSVNVTLWSKARPANRLRNIWLRTAASVRMDGDFRWFVPRRLTPGTASIVALKETHSRWTARCLKFVAEEFLAPPPPASYRWDQDFGPADFRALRIAALYEASANWSIIPCGDAQLATPVVVSWPAEAPVGEEKPSGLALASSDPDTVGRSLDGG